MAFGWKVLAAALVVLYAGDVDCSAEIMKNIAKGFTKGLAECKTELNLPDTVMEDLFNFWKGEYALVKSNDLGCTIICLSKKLELLTEDTKMHHPSATEFAKKHGADDDMAKKIVDMIHSCEKVHAGIDEHCSRVLEVAKCFKQAITELNWAPKMEEVLEEIMVDVRNG